MKNRRITAIALILVLLISALPGTALASRSPYGHTHTWTEVSRTKATCTKKGSIKYICRGCQQTRTESIPKLRHDYGHWKTTKEPTCTKEGEKERKCKVCRHVDRQKIDRLPHKYGAWTVIQAATCTEKGSRERTCADCGHVDKGSIKMLDHDFGEWEIIVEATDHSSGTRARTCRMCGTQQTEDYDPEGTLRRGARGDAVKALQQGLICYGALKGRADGSFGRGTERAVKAVQEAEGLEVDGVAWPQTLAFAQHLFGEWRTITPLTRLEDGLRERVCERCGLVEKDVIKALPTFERGDRGKPIEVIQEILGDMGFEVGQVDGDYGRRTEQAIEDWSYIRPDPIRPGRLRPIDIDHLVDDWMKLQQEEDRVSVSGVDTPVSLRLSVELVNVLPLRYVGEKMTFNWTVVNDGSEDCKLGPILLSYGQDNTSKDVHHIFHSVMSIDGNLLKANGENTLSGTFSIQIDRKHVAWPEGSPNANGDLYLNFRALGTSVVTGKKWVSNTVTDHYIVQDDKRDIDENLKLTARICGELPIYMPGDTVNVEVTVSNGTGVDLTDVAYEVCLDNGEGIIDIGTGSAKLLPAGASLTRYATYILEAHDLYPGQQEAHLFCEASAKHPDGHRISAERFPLTIRVGRNRTPMQLTVEQVSPVKTLYEVGDKVEFKWTLENKGQVDLSLDSLWVESPNDEKSVELIRKGPFALPAHGSPLTGTHTVTLSESWLSDDLYFNDGQMNYGRWCLFFEAAATPADGPAGSAHSNRVEIRLNSGSAGSDLVLEVEQLSPEKPFYEVDDEVTFAWKVTNVSPYDAVLEQIECTTPDEQGSPVSLQPIVLPANAQASGVGTHTVTLYDDWLRRDYGKDEGTWSFFFVAWADFVDKSLGGIRSNEVHFALEPEHYERTLQLAVEQTSPVKENYAAGEEVEFQWVLTNTGGKDLTLDQVSMAWGENAVLPVCEGPASLPAGGSLQDTWKLTLDPDFTVDDEWHLRFQGTATETTSSGSYPWYSNDVYLTLDPVYIKPNNLPLPDGYNKMNLKSGPMPTLGPGEQRPDSWRSLVIVEQTKDESAYYDGAKIPVKMRLSIDGYDSYRFVSITNNNTDSISEMDWTESDLEPGCSYDFVYTMYLDPDHNGWTTRNVTIKLISLTTDKYETESCEVRPPFTNPKVTLVGGDSHVIDYPAFLYLTVHKEAFSVYPYESLDIPVTVTTNAADEFSNVKLVCETDWEGKAAFKSTKQLAKKMAAHESRDFLVNLPVYTLKDKWKDYTVTFYATGQVTNVKGNVEEIKSLPVTLPMEVLDPDEQEGKLQLKYQLVPSRTTYLLNDPIKLRLIVRNSGSVPVDKVHLEYAEDYAHLQKLMGKIGPVPISDLLEPNEQRVVELNYVVRSADVEAKSFRWGFVAKGVVQDSGTPVRSNVAHVERNVTSKAPDALIELSVDPKPPMDKYPVGTAHGCRLHIKNDTGKSIKSIRIYAVGDNRFSPADPAAPWFDLGHGVKGWQCAGDKHFDLGIGESVGMDVTVVILDLYVDGSIYKACWAADAELSDDSPARSNVASLEMPVENAAPTDGGSEDIAADGGSDIAADGGSDTAANGGSGPAADGGSDTAADGGSDTAADGEETEPASEAPGPIETKINWSAVHAAKEADQSTAQADGTGANGSADAGTPAAPSGAEATGKDVSAAAHEADQADGGAPAEAVEADGTTSFEADKAEKTDGLSGADKADDAKPAVAEKASDGTESVKPSDAVEAKPAADKADGTEPTVSGKDVEAKPAVVEEADDAGHVAPDKTEVTEPLSPNDPVKSAEDGLIGGADEAPVDPDKPADDEGSPDDGPIETDIVIPGGSYDIPATVCLPAGDGPFPAVVMLHGTGSSRDEAGDGYRHAAPVLADKYGIATIRIDFPGNGESTADYMLYDFHSAVSDAKAAADYMASLDLIDGDAIGVMGWSQGGTDALLACAWEPETFKSLVTWAGAPDMMLDGFFSEADYAEAKANGSFVMEFDWRDSLNVSLQWCDDVANTDVLGEFSKGYAGPVLAIAGTDDDTVDPSWSEKIVAASRNELSRTCFIEGMDHTFNVFSEEDLHSLYEAVDATGAFFADTLGR